MFIIQTQLDFLLAVIYMCVCVCARARAHVCVCVCILVYIFIFPSIYLASQLASQLSLCMYTCVSIYLSIYRHTKHMHTYFCSEDTVVVHKLKGKSLGIRIPLGNLQLKRQGLNGSLFSVCISQVSFSPTDNWLSHDVSKCGYEGFRFISTSLIHDAKVFQPFCSPL